MHLLPPQRHYQDFVAVVRGIQYFGYILGTILLLASLFSGNTTVLLFGSVSALLVVGAVYLSTQGVIAVVELLSRIEVNTRGGLAPTSTSDRDPLPIPLGTLAQTAPPLSEINLPPLPDPAPDPDFFSEPPLPLAARPPQPVSLGLPILFTLAELEKKYQIRIVPRDETTNTLGEIALDITLTQSPQDHLAIIRELREHLRQQQVTGKVTVRVQDPQGHVRWENKVTI